MSGFFTIYTKKQWKNGVNSLRDAIVAFDPETAGEVAIAEMEEKFDEVNAQYTDAKAKWKDEHEEAVAIEQKYEKRKAKALKIQGMIADGDERPELTEALDQIVDALEEMRPDIEMEKQQAVDAKEVMVEMDEVVKMYAKKIKTARRDVKKIATQMDRAKAQEQRAKEREEHARMKAGLSDGLSGMGSVLESMNRQAEEATNKADTANRKADLLGETNVDSVLDDILAEPVVKKSAADRLAAL